MGQKEQGGGKYYIEGQPLSASFDVGGVTYVLSGEGLSAFRVTFVHGNPVEPVGVGEQTHRSNYLIGRSDWVRGARNFDGIRYKDVWDGVDVVFHVRDGRLKYDLLVDAGASPDTIAFDYEGLESMSLDDPTGDLLLGTAEGTVREEAPVAWQVRGDLLTSVPVDFHLDDTRLTFDLGNLDPRLPLVIDPGLEYCTYLGYNGSGTTESMTVDDEGAVYITGVASGTHFPTTPGTYSHNLTGSSDVFVLKLSPDLTSLVYSTFVGGSGGESGWDVAVDVEGNAHVTGSVGSSDFPTTNGAWLEEKRGGSDGFLFKLDPTGSDLLYSTYIASHFAGASERGRNLAIGPDGTTVVIGSTEDQTFPTTPGAYNNSLGSHDVFVMRFDTVNGSLVFSAKIGGSLADYGEAVFVDASGGVTVTASATSTDFPTRGDAFCQTHSGGSRDWVVFKLDSTGSTLLASTYLGSSGWDWPTDVVVDRDMNIFVTGFGDSADFPTTAGSYDPDYNGANEILVCKLDPSASALLASTFVGGSYQDDPEGIFLGPGGYVHVVGKTWSNDFPTDLPDPSPTDDRDVVLVTLDHDLSRLVYSERFGGNQSEEPYYGLHVDAEGLATFVGRTESPDLPVTSGAYCETYVPAARPDTFVMRVRTDAAAPELELVSTGPATTGDTFQVLVHATDNTNVSSVGLEHWFEGGTPPSPVGMALVSGNVSDGVWGYDVAIPPDDLSVLHLRFSTGDVLGFERTTGVYNVTVVDDDLPYFGEDLTPGNATTGDDLTFSVSAFDLVGVDKVNLRYWYAGGSVTVLELPDLGAGKRETTIQVRDTLDYLMYEFEVFDTSGNRNVTMTKSIDIIDDDYPVILEDLTPDTATTGDTLEFELKVWDNVGIEVVWVTYAFGGDTYVSQMMEVVWDEDQERLFCTLIIDVPPDRLDPLTYHLKVLDLYGNTLNVIDLHVTVLDNDRPEIDYEPILIDVVKGLGASFSVEASDNIGVTDVHFIYRFGSGEVENLTVEWAEGYSVAIDIPRHVEGDLEYHFSASDDAGNWNSTGVYSLPLKNLAPEVDAPSTWTVTEEEDSSLDLEPFLSDGNDDVANLVVESSDDTVAVEGLRLLARYDTVLEDWKVTVTVSDGEDEVGFEMTVHVKNVNDAPVIESISPENGTKYMEGKKITLSVKATDEEGDDLTVTWTSGGKTLGTGETLDYKKLKQGNRVIRVSVSDGTETVEDEITLVIEKEVESPGFVGALVVLAVLFALMVTAWGHSRR